MLLPLLICQLLVPALTVNDDDKHLRQGAALNKCLSQRLALVCDPCLLSSAGSCTDIWRQTSNVRALVSLVWEILWWCISNILEESKSNGIERQRSKVTVTSGSFSGHNTLQTLIQRWFDGNLINGWWVMILYQRGQSSLSLWHHIETLFIHYCQRLRWFLP